MSTIEHKRKLLDSIGGRISLGFGIVLALHLSIAAIGHVGLERASADAKLAKEMQDDAVSIVETDSAVINLQREVLLFTFTGHESTALRAQESQRKLLEKLDLALSAGHSKDRRRVLASMRETLASYQKHFASVVSDRDLRSQLLSGAFQPAIDSSAKTLRSLMAIERAGSQEIQSQLSLAHGTLGEAREAANTYLLDPSAKPVKRFRDRMGDLTLILTELKQNSGLNQDSITGLSEALQKVEDSFRGIVQATRSYLHLVNVVLAGAAVEFQVLSAQFKNHGIQEIEAVRAEVFKRQEKFQGIANVVSILTIILGIAAGFVISRSIAPPLKEMTTTLSCLADGEEAEIPGRYRRDEIGEMARAAEVFRTRNRETEKLLVHSRELAQQHAMANEELKEARNAAEHASLTKSEFLANMSHEIRTPMTAILGYADLLDNTSGDESQKAISAEAIQTIRSNANHLLRIINDILDMSKIEAGKMMVESVRTVPSQIVEEVVSLLRPRAIGEGIELKIDRATPIPSRILSDPTRLRQILVNLCGNAIKFTEIGSVTLKLSCDVQQEKLRIEVIDTGIGMNEEQCQVIRQFDAFNQADGSTTRKYGGTGLGLRISNSFAEMLGGGIELQAKEGEGCTFSVIIATGSLDGIEMEQLDSVLPIAPQQKKDECKKASVSLAGLKVLLAEDGPDNQRLISFHLRKAGADVTIVGNGLLAAEYIEGAEIDELPDVVLMDMQMPELDGYSATRRLRDAGHSLPVIALTAHAMAGDREKCLEAGCDDYTTKPINKVELLELCHHWGSLVSG